MFCLQKSDVSVFSFLSATERTRTNHTIMAANKSNMETSDEEDFTTVNNVDRDIMEDPPNEENLLDDLGAAIAEMKEKQSEKAKKGKAKKKEVPKFLWTTDATEALIQEWERNPILFDCTHPEYHVKEKRRITVENVRNKMISDHEIDPAPSSDAIVKKMNNLRTYFNAERNKHEASKVCMLS